MRISNREIYRVRELFQQIQDIDMIESTMFQSEYKSHLLT